MSTISQDVRAVPKATVSSIIEKLPLTKIHYMLALAAALGYMFDAFDTYIVGFAMPSIVKEWQLDPGFQWHVGFSRHVGHVHRRRQLGADH